MGKGTGLIGNFRKKVGNIVGYTLKNSNNGEKQGIRTYQAVVTNPKSDSQSAQRMKLMPLQVFYTAFSDVLNHAFEGRKVGQMNRQRFMQLNMTSQSGIAPAVQKGERILAPIHAVVSTGSLTQDTTLEQSDSVGLKLTHITVPSLAVDTDITELTLKEFTEALIANNISLQVGMEIAFIFIISSKENPRAGLPLKFNVVLNDTDSATYIKDLMGRVHDYIELDVQEDGAILIQGITQTYDLLGAAVIVSSRKSGGWSNNNARFYSTSYGDSLFYTTALYEAALATYGPSGSTLESTLFLRQADNSYEGLNPKAVVSSASTPIVLTGDYEDGVLSDANALLATNRAGYKVIVVNAAGDIVNANGEVITVTVGTDEDAVTSNLTPAMTSFKGLGTVQYGSF